MSPLLPSLAAAIACSPLMLAAAAGQPVAAGEAELPIRKIVMYRSGVGYFERQGQVSGTQRAQLRFEIDQINDILKSMVLLDLDGGRIDTVSYDAKESLARRLQSFRVDIRNAPSIVELFTQLRGTEVSISGPEGEVRGIILGVEQRPVVNVRTVDGPPIPVTEDYVSLVSVDGIRPIKIAQIVTFKILDEAINADLARAHAAIAQERAELTKTVDLSFSGEGNQLRRVVVSYIHEMPVWKTSYRLVLPETIPSGSAVMPDPKSPQTMTLQAWAIVENTTDADWKDVRLSLASGRPVSFTMDLYEPLFTVRPAVAVPVLAGVGPRIYESAVNMQRFIDPTARVPAAMGRRAESALSAEAAGMTASPASGDFAGAEVTSEDMTRYAAQAQASAGVAGETFLFTIDAPVSLERQRSAMLPILTAPVEGVRLSIYNASAFDKHPMRGVKITNGSTHLMPGPISVYDGGSYAGDSQIPHTSREQERILTYAVDLEVIASRDTLSESTVTRVRIVDGLLEADTTERATTKYTFKNNDTQKPRLMLVEQAKMPGWDLVSPAPVESTAGLYRFEAPLDQGASKDLEVVFERRVSSTYTLVEFNPDQLMLYQTSGKASAAVVDAFRKASGIQAKIKAATEELQQLQTRREEIAREQDRIRSNMSTIGQGSDLYRRYMAKLTEQETQVEENFEKRDATEQAREAARKELAEYLRNLKVE